MEKEIIESTVASLPTSELGSIQDDHEIWEETDGLAHLKVTRHRLALGGAEREIVSLSLSGPITERRRVIREFKEVFGVPVSGQVSTKRIDHIDVLVWVVAS